jgi:hypothetical protein
VNSNRLSTGKQKIFLPIFFINIFSIILFSSQELQADCLSKFKSLKNRSKLASPEHSVALNGLMGAAVGALGGPIISGMGMCATAAISLGQISWRKHNEETLAKVVNLIEVANSNLGGVSVKEVRARELLAKLALAMGESQDLPHLRNIAFMLREGDRREIFCSSPRFHGGYYFRYEDFVKDFATFFEQWKNPETRLEYIL